MTILAMLVRRVLFFRYIIYIFLRLCFFPTVDLKGGPFTAAQVSEFEDTSNWREKVQLRQWDDAAKKVDFPVPQLEHYRSIVEMAFQE